jgi:hypothetical protein
MVVSNALETDIEANRHTLQKHLDEVIEYRLADLKRATIRVVGKSGASSEGDSQEQIDFATAVARVEAICKSGPVSKVLTPQDYGWVFREDQIRRDPGSGQFQTKVKHTQKQPIQDKVASSMGIVPHPVGQGPDKKNRFTTAQKAQYQDEYRQLANFLGSVAQSTPNSGDTKIDLHFEDKNGNQWIEPARSTRPEAMMLDPRDRTLRGITAAPSSLNVGGMAFGLAGALGGGMSPQRVAQVNAGAAEMPTFAQSWTQRYSDTDTNARLYGRMSAGGKFLAQVAPAGSKANLAGHFGNFVGEYGPQAEAVIGPTARKTAYRYRGTEKTPDPTMVRDYEVAVRNAMSQRGFDEDATKATKVAQNRAVRAKINQVAEETNTPVDAVKLTNEQRVEALNSAKRTVAAAGASTSPTWEEQSVASSAIMNYLRAIPEKGGTAPRKGLYNLQLAAGNTPPSEGVILDRDGRIVTQAVGYGDDHYLPFNLKNLKGLKGGSYIRNRSVGGLTSEDIYTGLVTGARRVTVVSRSGTFTMEFEPDFRGGRRHNDKAKRMTQRYEQLLDAVQSEQVERQGIDPEMREVITQKVKARAAQFPNAFTGREIREEIKRKEEEYKASPDLDDTFDEYIHMIVNNRTVGLNEPDRKAIEATVRNQQAKEKEYKFRLNGAGYADALEGLREQFPYYIKVNSVPTKDPERHETERDQGYVEPGRLRPTEATVGLFGSQRVNRYSGKGSKISAAEANYAKPFIAERRAATAAPETTETTETPAATPAAPADTPAAAGATPAATSAPTTVGEALEQATYEDKATELQQQIQLHLNLKNDPDAVKWHGLGPAEFRGFLQNKDNLADFDLYVTQRAAEMLALRPQLREPLNGYTQASGRLGQKPYERILGEQWLPKPYAFPDGGKAYQAGADDATRHTEMERIGAGRPGIVNVKPLAQMTDRELEQEVIAVGQVRRALSGLTNPTMEQKTEAMKAALKGVNTTSPSMGVLATADTMDAYLETVHRTRAVNIGVPDAERGWQVEHTENPLPPEQAAAEQEDVGDRRERLVYLAEKTAALHPADSEEYKKLTQLKLDLEMQADRIRTPKALEGVQATNKDALDMIMQALHEGKVNQYEPAPRKPPSLPPGSSSS